MSSTSGKYSKKLAGKNVLVVGGTSGIGFCVAEACIESGANVTVSSSNRDKINGAIEKFKSTYLNLGPSQIRGMDCDLSQADTLEDSLKSVLESQGQSVRSTTLRSLQVTPLKLTPIANATVREIQEAGAVRTIAALVLAKLAPSYMPPGPESSITITGGASSAKPGKDWVISATWGAGREGMTRGLAVDLKPIRTNIVVPGAVHTEMFDGLGDIKEPVFDKFARATLTREAGKPEDVAKAYLYCMKDHLVTGSAIHTNGGTLLV